MVLKFCFWSDPKLLSNSIHYTYEISHGYAHYFKLPLAPHPLLDNTPFVPCGSYFYKERNNLAS